MYKILCFSHLMRFCPSLFHFCTLFGLDLTHSLRPVPLISSTLYESVMCCEWNLPKDTITCFNSDTGEIYAKKLANFVEKRLKSERAASVSFSSIQFSVLIF